MYGPGDPAPGAFEMSSIPALHATPSPNGLPRRTPVVRNGAALLEVMMAMVLAALLLTPLARSTALAVHHYTLASARDRGAALQSRVLASVRADPCAGNVAGDSTAGHAHVTWAASADSSGVRALGATVNTVAGELQVWGADICR